MTSLIQIFCLSSYFLNLIQLYCGCGGNGMNICCTLLYARFLAANLLSQVG